MKKENNWIWIVIGIIAFFLIIGKGEETPIGTQSLFSTVTTCTFNSDCQSGYQCSSQKCIPINGYWVYTSTLSFLECTKVDDIYLRDHMLQTFVSKEECENKFPYYCWENGRLVSIYDCYQFRKDYPCGDISSEFDTEKKCKEYVDKEYPYLDRCIPIPLYGFPCIKYKWGFLLLGLLIVGGYFIFRKT